MGNRCNNRGERRWLNYRKFWHRVKKHLGWRPELLKEDAVMQRVFVAERHNCSCRLCRERSKRYHGNAQEKYSTQELRMQEKHKEIEEEIFSED